MFSFDHRRATRRHGVLSPVRTQRSVMALGVVAVLLAACGSDPATSAPNSSSGPDDTQVMEPPVISSFTADPTRIVEGETALLSWVVNDPNATLKITPLRDAVAGTSHEVTPVVTTTYTLTASNALGSTVKAVTVSVAPPLSTQTTAATDDTAAEWVNAATNLEGLESECGNLSYVGTLPDGDTVIAGVALQGLWALQEGSDDWAPLGRQGATIRNRTTSLVQDPANPGTFWESGAYSGGGVYRTTDGGASFQQLGDISFVDLVSIDFTDPLRKTLVAGIHEQPILHRSTDGGASWVIISAGLPAGVGIVNAPLVIDAATYLVGTNNGDESGIFRTTDAGVTWARVADFGAVGRPVVIEPEGAIYWLLEDNGGIARSTDDGETWEVLSRGPSTGDSITLQLLPDGRFVAIGGGSLIVSADQGATWQRFGPPMPYPAKGFTYSATRNAFYAWRFDCVFAGDNSVPADAIIRLDVGPTQ
ncbi:MAG: hypothetical protein IPL07_20215 [Acidimicrobiaceae bacterium]|nr:hypothetical protein [Acidimicrobiaceae bacterium]